MPTTDATVPERFVEILDRLSHKAVEDYYNPYRVFTWPDTLPEDTLWMSADLLSTHGTDLAEEIGPEALHRLSRWESINFYSMNVEGIRELLVEVIKRIHSPEFAMASEFFHHFVGEENEHMWFFAEFCLRYGGGRIYSGPKLGQIAHADPEVENFLVFARILLFEEIVDFYNLRMSDDPTLHETIQQVNRIHHQDESRHIAFGRELVELLYSRLRDRLDESALREIETYLKRYLVFSIRGFYNPQVYLDAGISDPLTFRARLLNDERRRPLERKIIRKPLSFLLRSGIFADDTLDLAGV
ncbi:hypothetical protein Lfu02_02100 [Longispora fulva]|uniref:Para-aminobenzoate N-oxygenase AurF n=1 Tax=Longispora fulva TaxID=619741 RepID=A0A8J7KI90_9ACTN|nr:diiron oxygenase [Longispora fulva]MBG6135919.1 hypothetical protein [Longispora fulva]GIG55838.1 hypothetical protein Lfu02_02100 [Longispora fulva]